MKARPRKLGDCPRCHLSEALSCCSIGKLRHELPTPLGGHVEQAPERIHGVAGSMMPTRFLRRPGKLAAPEVANYAIGETKHVEHGLVPVLAVLQVALLAHRRRQLRCVSEILGVVPVAGRREKLKVSPPTLARPGD